jgi:hypothetical protein
MSLKGRTSTNSWLRQSSIELGFLAQLPEGGPGRDVPGPVVGRLLLERLARVRALQVG